MRARLAPVAVCLLALLSATGCDGRDAGRHGPAESNARLNAAGETPSWSAVVRPGSLVVSIGDAAPLQVKTTSTDHGKDGASFSGKLPGNGGTLSLAVSLKPCKDGETGLAYPMTAVAGVQGRRYAGCAAHAGQGLGPRT
jgi:uncharacterized membrane protein